MVKILINEDTDQKMVVALKGELDTSATQEFAEKLNNIAVKPNREVVFDFSELEYISSAGLRSLLVMNKQVAAAGGKVVIQGMSSDIKQIFQLTGFDNMFEIL